MLNYQKVNPRKSHQTIIFLWFHFFGVDYPIYTIKCGFQSGIIQSPKSIKHLPRIRERPRSWLGGPSGRTSAWPLGTHVYDEPAAGCDSWLVYEIYDDFL